MPVINPVLPTLRSPVKVVFLTDFVRTMQDNDLTGPLSQEAAGLVKDVFLRQKLEGTVETYVSVVNQTRDSGQVPTDEDLKNEAMPKEDPVLKVLQDVISGIISGKGLSSHQEEVKKYISNQQDRAELISSLLLTKDYQRLAEFTKARDLLERSLLEAAGRSDLNTSETMALMQLVGEQVNRLEGRVQAGASNISDVMALLNKADFALQEHEGQIKDKFKHTTPAGREIVRRIVHKLRKLDGST